jgi:hypothetical protein
MMAPNKTAALAWLGAQPGGAPLAVGMAGITDLQFKGLQLWLINLLPTWGSLVFNSWLTQGGGGLLTTRPVYDLLYGEGSSCWVRVGVKGRCACQQGVAEATHVQLPAAALHRTFCRPDCHLCRLRGPRAAGCGAGWRPPKLPPLPMALHSWSIGGLPHKGVAARVLHQW